MDARGAPISMPTHDAGSSIQADVSMISLRIPVKPITDLYGRLPDCKDRFWCDGAGCLGHQAVK